MNININTIKKSNIIQVFNYFTQYLDMYKVENIFTSEDNKHVFECKYMCYDEFKHISYEEDTIFIHEKDVMGVFCGLKTLSNDVE